jgi:hypothetical protein
LTSPYITVPPLPLSRHTRPIWQGAEARNLGQPLLSRKANTDTLVRSWTRTGVPCSTLVPTQAPLPHSPTSLKGPVGQKLTRPRGSTEGAKLRGDRERRNTSALPTVRSRRTSERGGGDEVRSCYILYHGVERVTSHRVIPGAFFYTTRSMPQPTPLRTVLAKSAPQLRVWHLPVMHWSRPASGPESRRADLQIHRATVREILLASGWISVDIQSDSSKRTFGPTSRATLKRYDDIKQRACRCMCQRDASCDLLKLSAQEDIGKPKGKRSYHELDNRDTEMLVDHSVQPNKCTPQEANNLRIRCVHDEFDPILCPASADQRESLL